MNTRSLLLLLGCLGLGIATMPSYAVCGDYGASDHYRNEITDYCWMGVYPCGGSEWHWHIIWPNYSSHTYSNPRARGVSMSGGWWAPGFSPNKSGGFGQECLGGGGWPYCDRCDHQCNCGNSDLVANICH